jgi:hypothetical protein
LARIAREQLEALTAAIHSHDFLQRIIEALEDYHRIVFHADQAVDWSCVRRSAEQILIAEIVARHRGSFDGIYFALRALENSGKPWNVAIHELAGRVHSYFTTPLGIVMRKDLFGEDAAFILADAEDWIRRREGVPASEAAEES